MRHDVYKKAAARLRAAGITHIEPALAKQAAELAPNVMPINITPQDLQNPGRAELTHLVAQMIRFFTMNPGAKV